MLRSPILSPGASPEAVAPTSDARWVLSGSVWVLLGRLLLGTSIVLQNVILARLLGAHDLGLFLLVQSIVLPAAICGVFGLDLLAMRELRDPRRAANAVSPMSFLARGGALVAFAAAVVALLLLVAMGAACRLFGTQMCGLAREVAPILWPLVALSAFQLLCSGILRALGRMAAATFLAGVLSTTLVLCATAVALALRIDIGFRAVLVLQGGALVAAAVASVVFLRGIPGVGRGGAASVAAFVRTGPLLLTTQLLALLVTQSDVWVFGLAASPEQVAQYGLAARLAQLVSLPHLVLSSVLPPMMASRLQDRRPAELQHVIQVSVALASIPAAALAGLFVVAGGDIMAIAFGEAYRPAALTLLILGLGNVANVACGPCSQLLIMAGHQRILNLITLANAAFCLVAGALAAAHLGAPGVATVYAAALTMQGVAGASAAMRLVGVKTHAGPRALFRAIAALRRGGGDAR